MTVAIQTCVRTRGSSDDVPYEGALRLTHGTWYFSYDESDEILHTTWKLSGARVPAEASKVLLRVWSSAFTIVTADMMSRKNPPCVEEVIDLVENPEMQKSIKIKLGKYLVFALEGSGPALGDVDDGLAEKLAEAQAALAQQAKKAVEEKAFLQDQVEKKIADIERLKVKSAEERNSLKKSFEKKEAGNLKELNKVKTEKARVENLCKALELGETAHEDEKKVLRDARDKLDTHFQRLENEKKAADRAIASAKEDIQKQKKLNTDLDNDNKRLDKDLANLRQTLVPENKQLTSENKTLQETVKSLQDNYDKEAAKNIEINGKKKRLESEKTRLERDVREAKIKFNESEKLRSGVERDFDRAVGDLKSLETRFKDEEKEALRLNRELRAEKSYCEAAKAELKKSQENREDEGLQAEQETRDLEIKIAGLESQIQSLELDMRDLEQKSSGWRTAASKEEGARLGAEREGERIKAAYQKAKEDLSAEEIKASSLEADLDEVKATLEAYQNALTKEKGERTKQLNELKQERSKHAKTQGTLEDLQKTSGARISKLNGDVKFATETITDLGKAKSTAEAKVEEKQRDVDRIQSDLDRQGRLLEEEKKKVLKLKEDLKKAIERELEYDPERLYEQLDNEKAAHKADVDALNEQLQKEKDAHAASLTRLEGDIKSRDTKIQEHEAKIKDLEEKLRAEQAITAGLRTQVQNMTQTITNLNINLTNERGAKASLQQGLNSEQSAHGQTRSQLTTATSNVTYWQNLYNGVSSQLSNAESTITSHENTISNLRVSGSHDECVKESSVDQLIGSYHRLIDTAEKYMAKYGAAQRTKTHYPKGLEWSTNSGKLYVSFRDYQLGGV